MISICTACTPWLSLKELLPVISAAGFQGIEIGIKNHVADPAMPPDFWKNNHAVISSEALLAELPDLNDQMAESGIKIAALGSYHFAHELDVHRRLVRIAQQLGCSIIRVLMPGHSVQQGYAHQLAQQRKLWRELADLGAGEGVRFCIELHDHSITPSASAALRILESLPEQGCAVILDAANTLLEGNEALPMVLDMLGTRLAHVHVKQRSFRRRTSPHRATMVDFPISPLHEPGDIVWTDIAALLRARDYAGWWSAEDFTASVDWRLKLQTQASWMRATLLGDSTLG